MKPVILSLAQIRTLCTIATHYDLVFRPGDVVAPGPHAIFRAPLPRDDERHFQIAPDFLPWLAAHEEWVTLGSGDRTSVSVKIWDGGEGFSRDGYLCLELVVYPYSGQRQVSHAKLLVERRSRGTPKDEPIDNVLATARTVDAFTVSPALLEPLRHVHRDFGVVASAGARLVAAGPLSPTIWEFAAEGGAAQYVLMPMRDDRSQPVSAANND